MSDVRKVYPAELLDCPLCGAKGSMRYRHAKDSEGARYGTHVWSCYCCPAVLFEYWEPQDVENVRRELAGAEEVKV